jgi:hypothetical protein
MNLIYNNIQFQILLMNAFDMEAVMSSDGMDYLYTKVRIDCQGICNPKAMAYTATSGIPIATPGTLPTTTVAAIRAALLVDRGNLFLTDVGAQTLIQSPPPGFPCDVKGGPFPKSCHVTEFQGSKTFFIRYVIETYILECPAGAFNNLLVLSNRWVGDCSVSENHLSTITYSGRIVFNRAYVEANGITIDNQKIRSALLPTCPQDFQRTHINIITDSSGNEIAWRTRDEGRMFQLGNTDGSQGGSGIVRISGSHGIRSISTPEGVAAGTVLFTLDLHASGNAVSNQWMMVQRLIVIAGTLINFAEPLYTITNASITEGLDQDAKWVDLSMAIRLPPTQQGVVANLRVNSIRVDEFDLFGALPAEPGGAFGNPPVPNSNYGTITVQLVVQALNSSNGGSCNPTALFPQVGSTGLTPSTPISPPPPTTSVSQTDYLPPFNPRYSRPTPQSYFTDYQTIMRYRQQNGMIQSPVSGKPQSSSGSPPSSSVPSCMIFQVAQPMTELICEGTAECVNGPPLLPSITPTDSNLVLASAHVEPQGPIIANDALTPVYRVSFSYKYFLLQSMNVSSTTLAMSALPWTALAFSQNYLTPDDFSPGIFSDPNGGSLTGSSSSGSGPDQ